MEQLPLEKAAEWALQPMRERQWSVAAQGWAILRKAYSNQPNHCLQGAKSCTETNKSNQTKSLLSHGRQHFPDNPNSFIISAELAIKREQWGIVDTFLQPSFIIVIFNFQNIFSEIFHLATGVYEPFLPKK